MVIIAKKNQWMKRTMNITVGQAANFQPILDQLDGVSPLDNRPSTDKLHHFVTHDMSHMTCDMWHMTHDM